MGRQIHKRLSKEFVEEVLEAFNEKRMTEEMALELVGVKRTRLYELRKVWLQSKMRGEVFSYGIAQRVIFVLFQKI